MLGAIVVACLGLLVYAWILYPLAMAGSRRRRVGASPTSDSGTPAESDFPPLAVIISAHNEEKVIEARLENLESIRYPRDRLTVFIGVDGSSDRTAELAALRARTDDRFHVFIAPVRRGKSAMLKDLVRWVSGSAPPPGGSVVSSALRKRSAAPTVLVFSDANTLFEPQALMRLVSLFRDPRVGGVCGRLVLRDPGSETHENVYWRWEARLKEAESARDSCLGANGAIYAVRRELFWQDLPDNTVIDDFVLGMKVRESGFRMVYEPTAVAHEDMPETIEREWRRRVRIGAGDFQALRLCRRCLSPRYGPFSWMFWSHKVLRWFTPHLFITLLVAGLWICVRAWLGRTVPVWERAAGGVGVAVVIGLMSGAIAGQLVGRSESAGARLLRMCRYFVAMQAALFAGFLRFCRGNLSGAWARTER